MPGTSWLQVKHMEHLLITGTHSSGCGQCQGTSASPERTKVDAASAREHLSPGFEELGAGVDVGLKHAFVHQQRSCEANQSVDRHLWRLEAWACSSGAFRGIPKPRSPLAGKEDFWIT